MIRIFFIIIALLVFPIATQNFNCRFIQTEPKAIEPKTVQEKYAVLQEFAKQLEQEKIIKVPAKQFAGFMLCVFYAESNLNPKANWDGQEGINQLTAATRRRLGMPESIVNLGFVEQLKLFKKYLVATKQGHKVHRVYDLHILNFSPYKVGQDFICVANPEKNLHYLDLDKDGNVTGKDMAIFIAKRCKENKFVYKIFKSLSA